jgi:2-amino-4-hydroxy-6-hydroxymethyldihydropteridine diphosphokinase
MRVYFSLGTNLGNRQQNLLAAVSHISQRIGNTVSLSAFYATTPWGFTSPNEFLNAALCTETSLSPPDILRLTQEIERDMGRTAKSVDGAYTDRLIDIDILLCDDLVIHTPTLTIPHPLMHLRRFVLEPLCEIAPDVIHPVLHAGIAELLRASKSLP